MRPLKNTRERILNVARGVFANISPGKMTMDDIARESKMGRRTIYSYFASKEELYTAVVNIQIEGIMDKLKSVSESEKKTEIKLKTLILRRMKAVKDICFRNPSVKHDFDVNPMRIEKLREKLDTEEIRLFNEILIEGVQLGEFRIKDTETTAYIIQTALKALERPLLNEGFKDKSKKTLESFIDTMLYGLKEQR